MKEAAGEANMTVITIILIGAIAAVAIPLVTSTINRAAIKSCESQQGTWNAQTKQCDY